MLEETAAQGGENKKKKIDLKGVMEQKRVTNKIAQVSENVQFMRIEFVALIKLF